MVDAIKRANGQRKELDEHEGGNGAEGLADVSRATERARTGLYSRSTEVLRIRARKVRRLVQQMRVTMPWIDRSDLPACRAWAELEILSSTVFVELCSNGVTNARGEPRRLLAEYRQLRQAQLSYERD